MPFTTLTTFSPKRPFLYTPDGWDTAWKAAKAASGSTPASVVAIGDSITAGQYSSDIMATSWFAQLRATLLSSLSLGGDYYGLLYSAALGLTTATPPMVLSGTSGTDWTAYSSGFNQAAFSNVTSLSPYLSCTPPYSVVGFDILYIDYSAGTPGWKYNVDGGADTSVNTTGPGTAAGAIVKKVSVTGLTLGAHTLNIKSVGVANGCNILGVVAYAKASAGLRFANMGWPGMGLVTGNSSHNSLADTGQFPPDRLALYQGYQGTSAAPSSLSGLGFPTQPDLAIIAFGVNDVNNSVSASTFEDNLRRLVQVVRYGKGDACSVLIVGMYTGDGSTPGASVVTSTDYTGAQSPGIQEFYDAMQAVAREYCCANASVHSLFGRTPATNGWITSVSNIHPNNSGYAKIANFLSQVL